MSTLNLFGITRESFNRIERPIRVTILQLGTVGVKRTFTRHPSTSNPAPFTTSSCAFRRLMAGKEKRAQSLWKTCLLKAVRMLWVVDVFDVLENLSRNKWIERGIFVRLCPKRSTRSRIRTCSAHDGRRITKFRSHRTVSAFAIKLLAEVQRRLEKVESMVTS